MFAAFYLLPYHILDFSWQQSMSSHDHMYASFKLVHVEVMMIIITVATIDQSLDHLSHPLVLDKGVGHLHDYW